MKQFQEIPEPQAELDEELEEVAAKGGDELFGEPTIRPSFYRCSIHGKILAQDVVWGPDDVPHCPEAGCGAILTR